MALRSPRPSATNATAPVHLPVYARSHRSERLWNLLPLTVSLFLATSLVWATYLAPWVLAVSIIAFFAYWVVRSYGVAVACLVGMRRLATWERIEWPAKYTVWLNGRRPTHGWEWPRHLVIIPNYKEGEAGLQRTLDSLAGQSNANQLVIVMAMEEREPGSTEKAARLVHRYRSRFAGMFSTFHPYGIPGETAGKGSNEAWAARQAYDRLIEGQRDDLARYTVTSCDADAVFHPRHFAALNYLFLTSPDPYRTFWEPAIFNSNNIWEVPAPLRMPDGLSGINRLSNLILPGSVRFPTSCYSLSWKMLDEVDYWDEEVIPEDWHLFLKSSYTLGDRVNCQPLFLPLGNDCVLTDGWWKTIRAHYFQSVRHAWGATDIPYAWRATLNPASPLSRRRKLLLAGAVTKVHSLWMAQWYIVTLGVHLPLLLTRFAGGRMPEWFQARFIKLPGPTVNWDEIAGGQLGSPMEPWVWLTVATAMVYFCLFPLLVLIAVEYRARGPKPAGVSWRTAAVGFTIWPLMGVITFFLASMPALHAQIKLARGKGLVYRVAEKGSNRLVPPAPSIADGAESYGVAGGGQ